VLPRNWRASIEQTKRAAAAWASLAVGVVSATAQPPGGGALPAPDLEDLGRINVFIASKRAEPAWSVGAALALVTSEDIRLSGVRTLGDALRLAPGLSVAQVDARDWMIGARGFDQQFANKLLVMADGRTIYTPLFGGVMWDAQDVVLEDLAQIEVVRGPGATLWGANAVNGVINLVTKPASETLGNFASVIAGGAERSGTVRLGAAAGGGWAYRVYARAARYGATRTAGGADAGDAWVRRQAGFRADRAAIGAPRLTLQGDVNASSGNFVAEGAEFAPPQFAFVDSAMGVRTSGANLLGRWADTRADGSGARVQAFVDTTWRSQAVIAERRDTADLDFQRTDTAGRHTWSWGAGYRVSRDRTTGRHGLSFTPAAFTAKLFSAFAQDQIALVRDRLDLVAGTKIEHNDFAGFEVQPGVRLVWRPAETSVIWAAVSRAVRSPTRTETGVRFDAAAFPAGALGAGSPPTVIRWSGEPGVRSEALIAYEAGGRVRPTPATSVDVTVFVHDYGHLIDIGPAQAPSSQLLGATFFLLSPWTYRNSLRGASFGAEASLVWQPAPAHRWSAGYTFTRVEQSGAPGGVNEAYFEGSTPENAAFVRARFTLAPAFAFEATVRTASSRSGVGVPSATVLDARVAWCVRPDFELELRGENLADPAHAEFREGLSNRIFQIRRSVLLRATLRR
jgi:iron complex outermembrane receptor protein